MAETTPPAGGPPTNPTVRDRRSRRRVSTDRHPHGVRAGLWVAPFWDRAGILLSLPGLPGGRSSDRPIRWRRDPPPRLPREPRLEQIDRLSGVDTPNVRDRETANLAFSRATGPTRRQGLRPCSHRAGHGPLFRSRHCPFQVRTASGPGCGAPADWSIRASPIPDACSKEGRSDTHSWSLAGCCCPARRPARRRRRGRFAAFPAQGRLSISISTSKCRSTWHSGRGRPHGPAWPTISITASRSFLSSPTFAARCSAPRCSTAWCGPCWTCRSTGQGLRGRDGQFRSARHARTWPRPRRRPTWSAMAGRGRGGLALPDRRSRADRTPDQSGRFSLQL